MAQKLAEKAKAALQSVRQELPGFRFYLKGAQIGNL